MEQLLRSIIIDDEPANHTVITELLTRHCPQVRVTSCAFSADEGIELIARHKPHIVFLDIKMPGRSGFDMLRRIGELHFEVIFISGFDEYAIQAFEFNAVDYVLKPIDYTCLVRAVNRAADRIALKKHNENIIQFIHSLDEQSHYVRKITLHQHEKVHVINLNEIEHIRAVRAYSEVVTVGNMKFLSAKPLNDYEILLSPFANFFRASKSILINADHIGHYTKGSSCFITMRYTACEVEVSRRRKTELLAALAVLEPRKSNHHHSS